MWILGITSPGSLNTAAVLVNNGKIIASAEEERFVRIKHAHSVYPHYSIEYVIKKAGIKLNDIDKIAVGWGISPDSHYEIRKNIQVSLSSGSKYDEPNYWRIMINRDRKFMGYLQHDFKNAEIVYVPHHLAHAASTCYVSGFDKSIFVTTDGRGDTESGLLGIFENDTFEVTKSMRIDESLGAMYRQFTQQLGWQPSLDEGKVMGLAPYGKPIPSMDDIAKVTPDQKIQIDWDKITSIKYSSNKTDPTKDERKDIAATAQNLLEKCVLALVKNLVETTGIDKICLAGGTALNIDMNGAILESGLVKDIFVQPAANDAGTALGAALYVHKQNSSKKIEPMKHAYLGPEFDDDEIEIDIKDSGLKYRKLSNVAEEVAELISQNKIIGWMQGRSEFGPRALGCRSLLANPTDMEMWKKVNVVKDREYWRPLAPSILEESMDEYFNNFGAKSPFMLLKFKVKEEKIPKIPAVVHVDGSARPQSVSGDTNQMYYDLIKKFEEIQGVPILMNTSLNLRGVPIVNNPQDALETLAFSKMDYMCIGNYLVSRN